MSLGWFLFFGKDFTAALAAMDRSVELSRRAMAIDPLMPIFQKTLDAIHMEGKRHFTDIDAFAVAEAQFQKNDGAEADFSGHSMKAFSG